MMDFVITTNRGGYVVNGTFTDCVLGWGKLKMGCFLSNQKRLMVALKVYNYRMRVFFQGLGCFG